MAESEQKRVRNLDWTNEALDDDYGARTVHADEQGRVWNMTARCPQCGSDSLPHFPTAGADVTGIVLLEDPEFRCHVCRHAFTPAREEIEWWRV